METAKPTAMLPTHPTQVAKEAPWTSPAGLRRIVIGGAIYVILALSGLLGFHLKDEHHRLDEQVRLSASRRTEALEAYTRLYFGRISHDLELLAERLAPASGAAPVPADRRETLVRQSARAATPVRIALLRPPTAAGTDRNGIEVIGDLPEALGAPDALDAYMTLRDGEQALYVGIPRGNPSMNEWFVVVSRRVDDGKGGFGGALIAAIPEATLRGFQAVLQVGQHGRVALLRNDGLILARHPFDPQFLGKPVHQSIVSSPESAATFRERFSLDGVDRLVSYRKLSDLPFVVVVAIAVEDAFDDFFGSLWLYALLWVGLVLTILGLLYGFLRSDRLRDAAEAARTGALQQATRTAQRLQGTLDSLAEAVFTFDDGGRIESANASAAALFGYSREEMVGRSILSFLRLSDAPDSTQLDELLATASVRTATGIGRTHQAFPVEMRVDRIDIEGRQLHVVSATDVSERLEAARQIEIRNSRFSAIFDSATQAMTLLRPDGVMLEANAALLGRTGIARDMIIGRPVWEAPWWRLVPDGSDWVRAAARRAAGGEAIGKVFVAVDRSGKQVHIDYSMKPIRNTAGDVIYLLVEARDVTGHIRTGGPHDGMAAS